MNSRASRSRYGVVVALAVTAIATSPIGCGSEEDEKDEVAPDSGAARDTGTDATVEEQDAGGEREPEPAQVNDAASTGVDASYAQPDAGMVDSGPNTQVDGAVSDAATETDTEAPLDSLNLTTVVAINAIYTNANDGLGARIPSIRVDGVARKNSIAPAISMPGKHTIELYSDYDKTVIMAAKSYDVPRNGMLLVFFGNDATSQVNGLGVNLMPANAAASGKRHVRLVHATPIPAKVSLRYVAKGGSLASAVSVVEGVNLGTASNYFEIPATGVELVIVDTASGAEIGRKTPPDAAADAYTYVTNGECLDKICTKPTIIEQFSCLGFFGEPTFCSDAARDALRK